MTIDAWKWSTANAMNRLYQTLDDLREAHRACGDPVIRVYLEHHIATLTNTIAELREMSK